MSVSISNFVAIRGVINDNVAPVSTKSYTLKKNDCNIPAATSGELFDHLCIGDSKSNSF